MTYIFETDEHAAVREQARRFAEREIEPNAHGWEEANQFPDELYKKAADAGLLGLGYPEEWGGAGGDYSHNFVASEELLVRGTSTGTVIGLGSLSISIPPILRFGSDELKDRVVRPVLQGDAIAALAVTEPGGGSDVAALKTRAVRDGDHYVINGSKTFITSGARAKYLTVAVRTGGESHDGISLIVVDSATPGFRVGRKLDKTGWWASDTAELFFEDCRVPVENLIGQEGSGFVYTMMNFTWERIMLAAQCVAIMKLALSESHKYVRERSAFGKTLNGHQVIRHKLAEMSTRLAAASSMVGETTTRALRGEEDPVLAAKTKNVSTDACSFVCHEATQIHGGYGYMREYIVERLYRDARLYPIGGGTREIMNELIAKAEVGRV